MQLVCTRVPSQRAGGVQRGTSGERADISHGSAPGSQGGLGLGWGFARLYKGLRSSGLEGVREEGAGAGKVDGLGGSGMDKGLRGWKGLRGLRGLRGLGA